MSRSLNKVELVGNVGADPEVRTTPTGGKVAQFSLATSRTWTDQAGERQEKTEWHRCVVWNAKTSSLADIVERYVHKGDKLYIEGRLEYRQWQDKDGQTRYSTEINVRELILLGARREGAGGGEHEGDAGSQAAPRPAPRAAASTAASDPGTAAAAAAVAAGEMPRCPKCAGDMWDNRASKRNPKAPDFKCKDRNCDGVVWPPRDGAAPGAERAPAPARVGAAASHTDDDDLPF
jgi:single-strand DNA-binding protein